MKSVFFHSILLAYLMASLLFWFFLSVRQQWLFRMALSLVIGGFVLQTGLLAYHWPLDLTWWLSHAPLGLLAWAIVAVYLLASWRYPLEALGAFIIPLAFLAAAIAGIAEAAPASFPVAFQRLWLWTHILLALLGYAVLALTFCTGVMYLMQEHQLKAKRFGTWYHRLPSLTLLDEVSARALMVGFPLLTQGIITGSVWAKYLYGSYFQWKLTSVPLLLAWVLYTILLVGRRSCGWQGRKAAYATAGGFIVVLASYVVHTL